MWKNHYKQILDKIQSLDDNVSVYNSVNNIENSTATSERCQINPDEVWSSIKLLKSGKSAGHDNITPKHIKYSSIKLSVMRSVCFSSGITHDFLPDDAMKTIIISTTG